MLVYTAPAGEYSSSAQHLAQNLLNLTYTYLIVAAWRELCFWMSVLVKESFQEAKRLQLQRKVHIILKLIVQSCGITISSNVVNVGHLQHQNGQDTPDSSVQTSPQHRPEAAAVARLPAPALSHRSPVWLFRRGSVLSRRGHHPYVICKEHQGNRGLSVLTWLTQFLRLFSFAAVNVWGIWVNSHPSFSWLGQIMTEPLHGGFIRPRPRLRTITLTLVSWAILTYKGPGKSESRGLSKQFIEVGEGEVRPKACRCPWIILIHRVKSQRQGPLLLPHFQAQCRFLRKWTLRSSC